jgi:hypothetical protein
MTRPLYSLLVLALLATTAAAADKICEPFNGKDLDGWKLKGGKSDRSKWSVGIARMDENKNSQLLVTPVASGGELVNAQRSGVDIYSEAKFGDCILELELMVPKGSNSGIYLMGNYEIQVFDSFGKQRVGAGDIGGIYGAAAPATNASKPPGEWQKFVIDFTAPKFENGKKIANAKFNKITLNGQVIHENVEVEKCTGGNIGSGEQPIGPLMFQGDHGPVAYRSIKITCK